MQGYERLGVSGCGLNAGYDGLEKVASGGLNVVYGGLRTIAGTGLRVKCRVQGF